MPLAANECWFDVKALFAGLDVPEPIDIDSDIRLEQIFPANLIAQAAKMAGQVLLGVPSPDRDLDLSPPVYGLTYRVKGKRLFGTPDDQLKSVSDYNAAQIDAPRTAFRRATALIHSVDLVHAGTFVWETDAFSKKRLFSYQFNTGTLSVDYHAAYYGPENSSDLKALFADAMHPYLKEDGAPIGVAIDRMGKASSRESFVDANLDLSIAAEVAFLFGLKRTKNEEITKTLELHAGLFFGDGEFFWSREQLRDIVARSYKERSNTVHGRKFDDPARHDLMIGLNAQLRETLRHVLRAYVERKPSRRLARQTWKQRIDDFDKEKSLGKIFA